MKNFLKKIYLLIPNYVRKNACSVLRRIYVPPKYLWHHLTFQGKFSIQLGEKKFLVNHTGMWIENSLFWKGLQDYEPVSLEVWMNACQLSTVVLDIGANTGIYSLIAKTVNPSSKIYAFEPLPIFNRVLKSNVKLNQFNIEVIEYAVSDFVGEAKLYNPEKYQGNLYSTTLSLQHYQSHQQTPPNIELVQVTTLDQFVRERDLKVDLVKIDAEGQDLNVLRGFLNSLKIMQPDFLIEIQSIEIGKAIGEILSPLRYEYFSVDEAYGLRKVDHLFNVEHRNFWICKPETTKKLNLV